MLRKLTRQQEKIMLEQAYILDKNVMRILRIAEKIERGNVKIGWLRREIDMGSRADPVFIMNKVKTKIADFGKRIYAKDEEFFTNTESFKDEKYIKNDDRKEFMLGFISMIQKNITRVPEEQKNKVWDYLIELTDAVYKYRDADPEDSFKYPT